MNSRTKTVALDTVAELNPRLGARPAPDELVSFVPMSAVSAETGEITVEETRAYAEVAKGYTSFLQDDVLVAKITPCFQNGKLAQAKLSRRVGFGSTEFHVIRSNADQLNARYLLHFLRQEKILLAGERRMTGSAGQRRVPENFFAKLEIPLPSLAEQRRIAEMLDRAEALRAKRRAALAQLDTLTQSLFLDLFGDPVTNPRGWPILPLSELGKIHTGKTPPSKLEGMFGEGIPFATPGDMDDELRDTERSLTERGAGFSKVVRAGSALVGCIGTIGKMAKTPVLTSFNQQINAVEWNDKIDDDYGIAVLPFKKGEMLSGASSTVLPILNKSGFSRITIPVPPISLQREFARRVQAVEKLKVMKRKSLAELDSLFSCLQHRAFQGDI